LTIPLRTPVTGTSKVSLPLKKAEDAKRVIILGAGASAADGAPLQAGLFRKYAEIVQRDATSLIHASSEGELRTLFYLFWGVDIDSPDLDTQRFPTFEEALGLLELAQSRNEFFKAFGGLHAEATRSQEMRAHLISLIALVLDDALRGDPRTHARLMTELMGLGLLNDTSFISLNYDLLADNAIRTVLGKEPDYSILFRLINDNPAVTSLSSAIKLMKIHGSLNWLFCPTCNELDCYPGEKILAEIAHNPGRMTCPVCQEPRVPVVIPPTFFKTMSNFYLQQVWKRTEDELRRADHFIFCGYTFPDADLHFKYLLKRAEINRPEGAVQPEIFIVNEHSGKTDVQRETEKDRFLRFFRNKGLVHWTSLSFSDFAENPASYADSKNWR
jgi:NAD-dependent SIR2 family protein deacetylase